VTEGSSVIAWQLGVVGVGARVYKSTKKLLEMMDIFMIQFCEDFTGIYKYQILLKHTSTAKHGGSHL
jgi:hypothetical protein